ncbi:MAG: PEP/pyruvate-binding domain-containing protein [Thermodesulfobacteriota bacterium]
MSKGIWDSVKEFFFRRVPEGDQGADDRELFVRRYQAFLEVLRNNHRVLMTLADMQEKSTGDYVFDRAFVRSAYETVAEGVLRIIEHLNALGEGRYEGLFPAFAKTDEAVRRRLEARPVIPKTDLVLPLASLDRERTEAAGGKLALLGELANRLGLPIPPGFVVTTWAFQEFIHLNRIGELIAGRTADLDVRSYDQLRAASLEIQGRIKEGLLPPALEEALGRAYQALVRETGQEGLRVSVRSSELHEDITFSFAGQFDSVLGVAGSELAAQYKRVAASLFTPRALAYYLSRRFETGEMAMAVGVLAMIRAEASGIMYSRDPEEPEADEVLINAVWGLGPFAVGGRAPVQTYRVGGPGLDQVAAGPPVRQETMLAASAEGGTSEVPVPAAWSGRPCLSPEQASVLASWARRTEAHFGRPQDLEWALDREGRLYLLQARALRPVPRRDKSEPRRPRVSPEHKPLLDQGTVASRGAAAGPVFLARDEKDLAAFPTGGVLVIREARPEFAAVLGRAAALVADLGGVLGHLATVAREQGVPAVFNTGQGTKVLTPGLEVTVDADFAVVYAGAVKEILSRRPETEIEPDTPALRQLRDVLGMIAPLNLTNPREPGFSPAGCRTLHDITRFSHEMALRSMFELSRGRYFAEHSAKRLVCEVPLEWWIIDLEDGLAPGHKGKTVKPEEIVSRPMQALWRGMTAFPWKGPPPVDTKGFMSVMFGAMTDPGLEPASGRKFVDKNYIVLSKNFCNLSSRLGFHFSTTEAYLGDNPLENYISFIFLGGGADPDRRARRVQLLGRVLERFDFRTETKGDSILARLEAHPLEFLEERLMVLGHLLIHTRQLDMVMYKEPMVDYYYRNTVKEIESFVKPGPERGGSPPQGAAEEGD